MTIDETSDLWMIYCDPPRLLWDAVPDPGPGAIGSNWQPVTREQAMAFVAEMEREPDWARDHNWAPRF